MDNTVNLIRLQQQAAEEAAGRQLTPHPGGLAGRVADAHDDQDEALAKALTDAWAAEE